MKKCGDNEDVLQLRHRLTAIYIKIFFCRYLSSTFERAIVSNIHLSWKINIILIVQHEQVPFEGVLNATLK